MHVPDKAHAFQVYIAHMLSTVAAAGNLPTSTTKASFLSILPFFSEDIIAMGGIDSSLMYDDAE